MAIVIISASRRTDIPAFHAAWFAERARAGFCAVPNPLTGRPYRVSLRPEDVDAIIFWSKNPRPLLPYLDEIDGMGYRYYFQFTLNDYPALFEPGIPPLGERLGTFRDLSRRLGPQRVIWRYDPVILSGLTPPAWHRDHFARLAAELKDFTRRVVVSVWDDYAPARRRLRALAAKAEVSFNLAPFSSPVLPALMADLAAIARSGGLEIWSCAEGKALTWPGITPGACVDAPLINRVWGLALTSRKDPGQRMECLCTVSRDIGARDTCGHGCIYCYATRRITGSSLKVPPDGEIPTHG